MEKQIKIALAGNPNSGKTTLFNALTGSNQFVGNWPGVTVEKKEGKLKKHDDVAIMDLPGIYSLSPYTLEEVVARNYLITERPDAILNIIDGTNLERNLYLTTQLTELGIPVVIAINMMDVVRKNGDKINVDELSRELGCKIVEISALKGEGCQQAAEAAIAAAKEKAEHDRIAEIGAQRLRRIMPEGVQGVIIAELNETEYTDPSYECSTTRSVRTVILGFSATSRNGFGELRKAAANFPQTAHLSEYDPKNEHRYPVFTLGKSPKYGWSVCKLTHYTREGYIDRLAYIAGNEENICLPEPKDEKRAERTETSVQGGFIIVDYSEKAIAVFGDTKPVKDALHALGGRFNARLTHDGQKRAGWIFQKTKEDEVRRLLGKDE